MNSQLISGMTYTREGPDFRLEEINKHIQQWLPKGPTGKDWENVWLNFDKHVKM